MKDLGKKEGAGFVRRGTQIMDQNRFAPPSMTSVRGAVKTTRRQSHAAVKLSSAARANAEARLTAAEAHVAKSRKPDVSTVERVENMVVGTQEVEIAFPDESLVITMDIFDDEELPPFESASEVIAWVEEWA